MPLGGLDNVVETANPSEGVLTHLVRSCQRDMDHAKASAEESWDTAKAEKQDYATRAQLFTGVAVLALTAAIVVITLLQVLGVL